MLQSQSNMCIGLTIVTQVRNTHRGGETNGLLPIRDPFSRESVHHRRILSHRRKLKRRSGSSINYDVPETAPAQWHQINCEYLLTCSHTDLRSLSQRASALKVPLPGFTTGKNPDEATAGSLQKKLATITVGTLLLLTAVLCTAVLWAVLCVRKGKEKMTTNQKNHITWDHGKKWKEAIYCRWV